MKTVQIVINATVPDATASEAWISGLKTQLTATGVPYTLTWLFEDDGK